MITFAKIKQQSESYAKMMRDLFPASFENEKLNEILNKIVFDDEKTIFIEKLKEEKKETEFKTFIYSLIDIEKEEEVSTKSIKELLDEAWYNFFICKTKEDVLRFKKYYKENELLCTFNNIEGRLNNYNIFWIVSKSIENIKRENFKNPTRQDEYWVSCCSIQISKNDISIKNRYNHTVNNPDNTFNNNLDNIISWLSKAFEKEFWLDLFFSNKKSNFEINKFIFKNNKFIYFNYEFNNIYYWINKIYKNWEIKIYDTNKFILIDYFLINLEKKCFEIIDNNLKDDFFNLKFSKIIIKKEKDNNFKNEEDQEWTLIIYK